MWKDDDDGDDDGSNDDGGGDDKEYFRLFPHLLQTPGSCRPASLQASLEILVSG